MAQKVMVTDIASTAGLSTLISFFLLKFYSDLLILLWHLKPYLVSHCRKIEKLEGVVIARQFSPCFQFKLRRVVFSKTSIFQKIKVTQLKCVENYCVK